MDKTKSKALKRVIGSMKDIRAKEEGMGMKDWHEKVGKGYVVSHRIGSNKTKILKNKKEEKMEHEEDARKRIFGEDNKEWYKMKDRLAAKSRETQQKKKETKEY